MVELGGKIGNSAKHKGQFSDVGTCRGNVGTCRGNVGTETPVTFYDFRNIVVKLDVF
jgi:hypothetical protein